MTSATLEKIIKVVQICLTVIEYAIKAFIPVLPSEVSSDN